MRTFRPSGKAAAVAGAIALTLVVGASSGAVAGKLITSKNIKDGTVRTVDLHDDAVTNAKLAPGSVDWDKALDDATRSEIESMAGQDGAPGPQGPQGPRGFTGPAGPAGTGGELIASDFFGVDGWQSSEDEPGVVKLTPASGEDVVLGPGNYLVSVQAVILSDSYFPFVYYGALDEESFLGPLSILDMCLGSYSDIPAPPTCDVTYPFSVQEGDSVTLQAYVPGEAEGDCSVEEEGDCGFPGLVETAVYKMGGDIPTDFFEDDICPFVCGGPAPADSSASLAKQWNKAARQLTLK